MSDWPTKIPDPIDRAPRLRLVILNQLDCFLSSKPCNSLPKPLNITLIATDNRTNGISDTVLGDTKAIIANVNAKIPRPIFVMRVLFLRTGESWDVDESNNTTKDTLSIPMINNVIDSRVITVSSVKVGNPNMSTKEDRTSKTIPLNICNERNQLGGTESTISD
jgi:hypothetical protein